MLLFSQESDIIAFTTNCSGDIPYIKQNINLSIITSKWIYNKKAEMSKKSLKYIHEYICRKNVSGNTQEIRSISRYFIQFI